jgi:uncharacterized protein
MDKVYEIGMLLDFYGQLLTKKQFEILDMHYNNDYSLAEIAEYFNISRQAVHDNIKRSKQALGELERKLNLVSKFQDHKDRILQLEDLIKQFEEKSLSKKEHENIMKIKSLLDRILNEF